MITGNFMNAEAMLGWHAVLRAMHNFLTGAPDMTRITMDDAIKLENMAALIREKLAALTPKELDRCAVCGWRLSGTGAVGCVRGSCSQRPILRSSLWYDTARAIQEYAANGINLIPDADRSVTPYVSNFMGRAGDQSKEST